MCKKFCATTASWIPTILRVVAGIIFIAHGWQKLGSMDQTIGFFAQIGVPVFLAWLISLGEFVGGILLILGLYTRVAAIWLGLIMFGAISLVHLKNGLFGPGGYEYPLTMLAVQVVLIMLGGGNWSVDEKLTNRLVSPN